VEVDVDRSELAGLVELERVAELVPRPGWHPNRVTVGSIDRHEDVDREPVLVGSMWPEPSPVRPAALARHEHPLRFGSGAGCDRGNAGVATSIVNVLTTEGGAEKRIRRKPRPPRGKGAPAV